MKNKLLICILFFVVSCGAKTNDIELKSIVSGHETGNGGYGVKLDNNIFALDLVVRGIHNTPYMSQATTSHFTSQDLIEISDKLENIISSEVLQNALLKISDLMQKAERVGYGFTATNFVDVFKRYTWNNLSATPCLDVGDATHPIPNQIQLAFRQQSQIHFCKEFYEISHDQQVALLVHEILYAKFLNGQPHITSLVGILFDPKFENFESEIQNEFRKVLDSIGAKPNITGLEYIKTLTGEIGTTSGFDVSLSGKFVGAKVALPDNNYTIWSVETGEVVSKFPIVPSDNLHFWILPDDKTLLQVKFTYQKIVFKILDFSAQQISSFEYIPIFKTFNLNFHISKDKKSIYFTEYQSVSKYDIKTGQKIYQKSIGSCKNSSETKILESNNIDKLIVGCSYKLIYFTISTSKEQLLANLYDFDDLEPILENDDRIMFRYKNYGYHKVNVFDFNTSKTSAIDGVQSYGWESSQYGIFNNDLAILYTESGYNDIYIVDVNLKKTVLKIQPINGNDSFALKIPNSDFILLGGGSSPELYRIKNN